MWNKFFKNYDRGFTLIELMVSIFVLSIAIIGAYSAFNIMDILTSNATDRFVAAYLAQEGMEIVRNMRDTNWLEGDDWMAGLVDSNIQCQTGCQADYKTFDTLAYYDSSKLLIDDDGFYNYSSGTDTKYKRKIVIEPIETTAGLEDIMKVTVTVYWDEKSNILHPDSNEDSITVEEYLYNWY